MAAKTPATAEELRAELDGVRRESLRAEAERSRAEEYKARLEKRDLEIDRIRDQLQQALQAAEGQLAAAAAKIAQVSQPPPPSTLARDLDEARVRMARLQAELAELHAERDDLKRQVDGNKIEVEGLRASAVALHAAVAVRDIRSDDAVAAARTSLERAAAAEKEAAAARAELLRQGKSEEESRALALGAQERFGDIRAQLDHVEGELEAERTQARARESQMIAEVRERETKMVQEVREREAQLVAAAQAREAQLAAAAQGRERQLAEDLRDATDQIAALTHLQADVRERESKLQQALDAARGHEASLDAELRSSTGTIATRVLGMDFHPGGQNLSFNLYDAATLWQLQVNPFLTLEQAQDAAAKQIGYTISWFPPQTRFFSSNDRIAIAGVPLQTPDQNKCTREQYLAYLRTVALQYDLRVNTYEPVVGVEKRDGEFLLTTRYRGGQRGCRAKRVVLATVCALRGRRAAELAAPQHERVFQQSASLQVGEQRRDRLIHFRRVLAVVGLDARVRVPGVFEVPAAGVESHEPHAAFN